MKYPILNRAINCPICGKELIPIDDPISDRETIFDYWCDDCDIDITIEVNDSSTL